MHFVDRYAAVENTGAAASRRFAKLAALLCGLLASGSAGAITLFGPPGVQPAYLGSQPAGTLNPEAAAAGDFNNDGYPDAAVVNYTTGTLIVYTTDPIGILHLRHEYGFGLVHPSWVTAADVNGNGKLDLLVGDELGLSVFLGQGNANADFVAASPQRPALPGTTSAPGVIRIVARDLNHDGRVDLVMIRRDYGDDFLDLGGMHATVLLGLGGGTFGSPVDYDLDFLGNTNGRMLTLGNFDGDSEADVVYADGSLFFMKGNGNGTFQPPVEARQIPFGPHSAFNGAAEAVDMDGDGKLDYLYSSPEYANLAKGNGDGTFQAPVVHAAFLKVNYGFGPVPIVVGDFNLDGRKDFAVAGQVQTQTAAHTFVLEQTIGWGTDTGMLAAADFNGDLRADILGTANDPNKIAVFRTISGPASKILITGGNNQSTPFSTLFSAPLTIQVVDANNVGVANVPLSWVGSGSGPTALLAPADSGTSPTGTAQATATANNTLGCYQVSVTAQGIAQPAVFDLCNVGSDTMAVSGGNNQSTLVGTTFIVSLQVTVRDAGLNPKPGVAVTFHPPASGASAFMTPGPTAITDSFGIASVDADANGVAGVYNVVATANGVPPVALTLTNTAPPSAAAQIVVPLLTSPQARQILTDFAPLRVQVVDSSAAPVAGATVNFAAQPNAASGASAQLLASSAVTDGTGHAQIDATANTFVGWHSVKVGVQNNAAVPPASISLRNYAPLPSAIATVWGTPQQAQLMNTFSQTLRVRLTDNLGQPTPQVRVYFVAPVSGPGATLSAASALTDLNGFAEVTATANDLAGSYQVAATVFETSIEQTIVGAFALTNTADAAVVDVPTLGEYGIALLAVLLAGSAVLVLRRQ